MKFDFVNVKLLALVFSVCLFGILFATTQTLVQAQPIVDAPNATTKVKTPTLRDVRMLLDAGDFASAYVPLKHLARNGSVEADYLLYTMYAEGKGVKADIVTAIKFLRAAATQNYRRTPGKYGYAEAQYVLAKRYAAGEGVTKNAKNALDNFIRAARQGNQEALSELPAYYAGEKGVAANAALGYEWSLIGVKQSSGSQQNTATAYANKFKASLSERKRRQIEIKAAKWETRRD